MIQLHGLNWGFFFFFFLVFFTDKFLLFFWWIEKFENNIFFFSVSKTPPSLCYIVRQLYEHKKIEVPVIANETAAINLLEEFMNQIGPSPILLVLDDVWPETGSHIEKLILKIPGYKILVTSREKLPKFGPQYPLRPLDDEDAMALFRHHCPSLEDGSSDIPGHIVKEVCCSVWGTYIYILRCTFP